MVTKKKTTKKSAKKDLGISNLKMSKLIRVAVKDMQRVMGDPRYIINMGSFHEPNFDEIDHVTLGQLDSAGRIVPSLLSDDTKKQVKCEVCFAGAVMSRGLDVTTSASPEESFDKKTAQALRALDALRDGEILRAYEVRNMKMPRMLVHDVNTFNWGGDLSSSPKENRKNRQKFIKSMLELAGDLEKFGE